MFIVDLKQDAIIRGGCSEHIGGYSEHIGGYSEHIVDAMSLTAVGKINRNELRARAATKSV